jgi:peroxiredoxin
MPKEIKRRGRSFLGLEYLTFASPRKENEMSRVIFVWALALGIMCSPFGRSGEFNTKLNIGDSAPTWKDLPGADGKNHSLTDLADKPVVVVVFTCNSCPVASSYEDRLISFARKYSGNDGKVALVAVNVNTVPEDRLDKMTERAKEKGFNFPYVYDKTQKLARDFGAEYTPEFFVLNKERKVVYMGAMDDNSTVAQVKMNYLEPATEAALRGEKAAKGETMARGCKIRFARERK